MYLGIVVEQPVFLVVFWVKLGVLNDRFHILTIATKTVYNIKRHSSAAANENPLNHDSNLLDIQKFSISSPTLTLKSCWGYYKSN